MAKPKVQVIASGGTEPQAQALAAAIRRRIGAEVGVSHMDSDQQPSEQPAPTTIHPRDREKFGRILDTLAVLHETEHTLKTQALQLIADHPGLIRDNKTLALDDRIANTISNRQVVRTTYGESRPIHPPEQFILAGAAAALGGEAKHLGALVFLSAQHVSATEGTFRDGLNRPEQWTIALGEQIERRIAHPTVRNVPGHDHEPGDD